MVTMTHRQGRAGRSTTTRAPRSARASSSRATSSSTSSRARPARPRSPTTARSRSTRPPSPVQFDQLLTSLQSDTREDLKTLLDEYGKRARQGRRGGLQPLDPVLEERLPRHRDRQRGLAGRDRARPLRLRQERGRDGRGAGPQPRAAQEPDHRLQHDRRRVRPRAGQPAAPRSPSCRARCAPPSPRSARSTQSFPPLRALTADLRPGVQSSEAALDASIPLVRAAARPGLRGRAARPRRRPAPDRAGARPPGPREHPAGRAEPPAGELPERGRPAVGQGQGRATSSSRPRARSTQEAPKAFPGLAGESRSGDANGQWFRVLAAGGTNLVHARARTCSARRPRRSSAPTRRSRSRARRWTRSMPCETQESPDLRSQPAAPPTQRRSTRARRPFQDRYALAKARAGCGLAQGPAQGRGPRRQAQGHRQGRDARA